MEFNPRYKITNKLLANIKKITELVIKLNMNKYPNVVLRELARKAREISVYSSTNIEGNPLPLTDVKRILKSRPEDIRDTEREVLNYNEALLWLNSQLIKKTFKLSNSQILTIHKKVVSKLLDKNKLGKFRDGPVIVNDPRSGKTVFIPPDVKDMIPLMTALLDYVESNKGKVDPLVLSGIFHKQFAVIHPFIDGNGRVARLCTKALLSEMGLDTFYLFSFENYYNNNVAKYFEKVGEYGDYYEIKDKIDFTVWLEYFTDGIIDELLRVRKQLIALPTPEAELKEHDQKIINYIKRHGFINNKRYSQITDRAKATRSLDFKRLISLGIIKKRSKGKATYYILK